LELAFATRNLRRICENESVAREILGVGVAAKLKARLADLDSARTLAEVVVGHLRPAGSARCPDLFLDLTAEKRLVLRVNHSKLPLREDGAVEWGRVDRVRLIRLEGNDV
jgi:hypothetical protein